MASGSEQLEIQLEEIKSATNNFDEENVIGRGGFGKVYKGELCHSHSNGKSTVAIKRLNRKLGQGETEFHKEVRMLSCYRHDNIISLLGFSRGRDEMILVYEYASRGSLDRHLKDVNLTWTQRLKICLDAAKGLCYLHDPRETSQRLIHCDIKSANILLDDNFSAKVSDFGLSKICPAANNLQNSILVTGVLGTHGYCDPLFMETYTLTKESDVYSFGVVLFEVLCGKLCFEDPNGQFFVPMWKQTYEQKKLREIVFQGMTEHMSPDSLDTFADIAYNCLKKLREERPAMSLVVEKLQKSLELQELYDIPKGYKQIVNAAVHPLKYRSSDELKVLFMKGFHVNDGKTWFSINDKKEHCLMLSIEDCLIRADPNRDYSDEFSSEKNSRFVAGCYKTHMMKFKICVITPLFLSLHVTYGVNLVFQYSKIEQMKQQSIPVMYKLLGETKISMVNAADTRENGWLVAVLYHFTNEGDKVILDFEIMSENCGLSGYFYIEGIEFQPLGKVEHPVVVVEYEEILKAAATPLFYRSTEELKLLLTRGILLNGAKTLFFLNGKGEHIERIFIEACLNPDEDGKLKHCDDCGYSRFPGGRCYRYYSKFEAHVRGQYLTPHISYMLNLVFRYEDQSKVNSYDPLRYKIDGKEKVQIIYSINMMQDGWFIVPLYQFTSQHTNAHLQFEFEYRHTGLLVAGIEFQPSEEKVELQEEYQAIVEAASQTLLYRSLGELKQILSKGVYLNGYKTWFSLNKKGEHCHMISMKDCLIPNEDVPSHYQPDSSSRFLAGLYQSSNKGFKTHVTTQFLSPLITYTVNLVFRSSSIGEQAYVDLKYRLRGESTTFTVYLAKKTDGNLYMAELYQFTSDGSILDLEIIFENSGTDINGVEGIMFLPLENVEDPLLNDGKVEDIQSKSDSGNNTAKKKKNLHSTFGKWFHSNNQEWSYLDKNEKKCVMLSARLACYTMEGHSTWRSLPESRFRKVLVITAGDKFELVNEIETRVLSASTTYATYFVYKLPSDQSKFESPLEVSEKSYGSYYKHVYSYLVSPPNTPVIGQKFDKKNYNPLNRHKGSCLPRQRSDGWMEVKVWEFKTESNPKTVSINLKFKHPVKKDLSGLITDGIELRPI